MRSTVECPHCGSPAALRLAEPDRSSCRHCGQTFALPAAIAARLRWAAGELAKHSAAERQMQAFALRALRWQKRWLSWVAAFSVLLALSSTVYAARAYLRDGPARTGDMIVGGSGVLSAVFLFAVSCQIVPRLFRTVLEAWSAIPLPGNGGLGCRACGASLPQAATPVLRCAYCGADNLAPIGVLRHVSARARRAGELVVDFDQKQLRAQSRARMALALYPVGAVLGWLSGALFAEYIVGPIMSHGQLPASDSRDFALVRVQFADASVARTCIAFVDRRGARAVVSFGYASRRLLTSADLGRHVVGPAFAADWLVGRRILFWRTKRTETGTVTHVFRPPKRPSTHEARVDGRLQVNLPSLEMGEHVCLADEPAGASAVAPLRTP